MMRSNYLNILKTAVLGVAVLLLEASAFAQQQVNLTAGPTTITLPDGNTVPMWGYSCGAAIGGSNAACAKLNPNAPGWSPVVITVPATGSGGLQINLTNNLSFANSNSVPTSLTIVGLVGGGLGKPGGFTASPTHGAQQLTWPVQGDPSAGDPTNTPPPQGPRVQSFSTEVAAGATTSLTWTSGNLRPGTYLLESGTHPSIQGSMGLYGMVVVTDPGTAYPNVTYNADVKLLFSEIDPVQNNAVNLAVNTAGFSETAVWSGQPGGCGVPTTHTCYPPAVNYTPLYYLINGVAFDRTNAAASLFPVSPASGVTGSVLVRLVNAGLRMHVPAIVGSLTNGAAGFSLIAEDGNPLPGTPRVQSEVFMAAGKTYDVMVSAAGGAGTLPIYDRALGLSGNATARDGGMLAYIGINGGGSPVANAAVSATGETYYCVAGTPLKVSEPSKGVLANDSGASGAVLSGNPADHTLKPFGSGGGSTDALTLNPDGTFTYTQDPANTSCGGSFTYLVNGNASYTATATITQCDATSSVAGCSLGGAPIANPDAYTSRLGATAAAAAKIQIAPPGVLANDTDPQGHPLTASAAVLGGACNVGTGTALASGVTLNPDGSFSASLPSGSAAGAYKFCYRAANSQKTQSGLAAVTLNFPAPSNLAVTLVDGVTKAALDPQDYRWIIEEDRTFFVDPSCQTNPLPASCPTVTPQGTPAIFGTNFHTSYMPVVAQGCVGTISCEDGQFVLSNGAHVPAACDLGNGLCRTDASQKAPLDPGQVVLDPAKRYYISVLPGDAIDPGHQMGGAPLLLDRRRSQSSLSPCPSSQQRCQCLCLKTTIRSMASTMPAVESTLYHPTSLASVDSTSPFRTSWA